MVKVIQAEIVGEPQKVERKADLPPVMPSTPILYSDFTGVFPGEADVTAIIAALNKGNTFFMLCMVNSLLSFFAREQKDAIEIQKLLQGNCHFEPFPAASAIQSNDGPADFLMARSDGGIRLRR